MAKKGKAGHDQGKNPSRKITESPGKNGMQNSKDAAASTHRRAWLKRVKREAKIPSRKACFGKGGCARPEPTRAEHQKIKRQKTAHEQGATTLKHRMYPSIKPSWSLRPKGITRGGGTEEDETCRVSGRDGVDKSGTRHEKKQKERRNTKTFASDGITLGVVTAAGKTAGSDDIRDGGMKRPTPYHTGAHHQEETTEETKRPGKLPMGENVSTKSARDGETIKT